MPTSSNPRRPSTMRLLGTAVPLLLAAACAPGPEAVAPRPASLAQVIDSVLRTPPLHTTQWGIAVFDPAAGRIVYALNAERNFIPASNLKLVAGAVALAHLGPEYRYRTPIHAPRRPGADSIAERLVVAGRGDPTLSRRFHPTDFAALDSMADSLASRGVRRITDGIVVDASHFDDERVNPMWLIGNLASIAAAPVTAFAVAEGEIRVVVEPGARVGAAAAGRVPPLANVGPVELRVVTLDPGEPARLAASRDLLTGALVLAGGVPLGGGPDTVRLASRDPAEFAGLAFAAALAARGIVVDGGVRLVHDTAEARVLDAATPPAVTWTSPPMGEIVAAFMRPSQNWITEQVVRTLGAERGGRGTRAAGLDVLADWLVAEAGIDEAAFALRDGSGLSPQNLIAPLAVIRLLEHARHASWAAEFRASLPVPGEEGTLERRLTDLAGRIAAKTGTITNVNGLSGYVVTRGGRELSFSILTNATGLPAAPVREGMDRIVRAMAESGPQEPGRMP